MWNAVNLPINRCGINIASAICKLYNVIQHENKCRLHCDVQVNVTV